MGGGTYTGPLLAANDLEFSVRLPAGQSMADVVLAADSSLRLINGVRVIESAPAALPMVVNTGTGDTTIGPKAELHANVWSQAGVTFIGQGNSVSGSVTTAGVVKRVGAVTIGGSVSERQSLTTTAVTWRVVFPPSNTEVVLKPRDSRTLAPGAYATVVVSPQATLTLQTGTYFFDSLTTLPHGRVLLEGLGPFVVYVRTQLVYKGPIVLPAGVPDVELLVGFAGTSHAVIGSPFEGTFVAPRADVKLLHIGDAVHRGSFFAKALDVVGPIQISHRAARLGRVTPIAECVVPLAEDRFKAVFGYLSTSIAGDVIVPVGSSNRFDPAPENRGQPTRFQPGRREAQVAIEFDGKALAWELDGGASTANAMLPQCTPECVEHLLDPSKPRQEGVVPLAALPMSTEESIVLRDAFDWEDTLPVPELGPDGAPRLYYGLVYVDSRAALDALDALRIHYDGVPMFEEQMQALETAEAPFSYDFDGAGQFVFALIPGAGYNALRAAALDPAEPAEIFRAFQVRPIPAVEAKVSCGLAPKLECVAQDPDGTFQAVFGYDNPAGNPVTVPVGEENAVTGGSQPVAPPEAFDTGRHTAVFAVAFPAGATVTWSLADGSAVATGGSPRCSPDVVAQIGKDRFTPFPRRATVGSCRVRTPAEQEHPASTLPPTMRVNTCSSIAYSHAGKLGFKWRGVDSDSEDERGLAADAELEIGEEASPPAAPASQSSGGVQAIKQPLFGKIFRRIIKSVARVIRGAVDGVRVGVTKVAGAFIGSHDVSLDVNLVNRDPWFNPVMMPATPMVRVWGQDANKEIPLPGVGVRAYKGFFLRKATLSGFDNRATVAVLDGLGARICFEAANADAELVNGWFLPPIVCGYTRPGEPRTGLVPGSGPAAPIRVHEAYMNTLAQMNDSADYLRQVADFMPNRVEVAVGGPANLVGQFNGNRAFAGCFAFSLASDASVFAVALGAVAGNHAGDFVVSNTNIAAKAVRRRVPEILKRLLMSDTNLLAAIEKLTGTLRAQAEAALALLKKATAAAQLANAAAIRASQAFDDLKEALALAARLEKARSNRLAGARAAAERALQQVGPAAQAAQSALSAALAAAKDAQAAIAAVAANPGALPAAAQLDIAKTHIDLVADGLGAVLSVAVQVVGGAASGLARGAVGLVTTALALPVAEIFEVLAGGDIVLPANRGAFKCVENPNPPPPLPPSPPPRIPRGLCLLPGNTPNAPKGKLVPDTDARHDRAIASRGVPTHEYGHYALCNLLERVSPTRFSLAYNEAAADGFLGQTPTKQHVVINEAFADFFGAQVMGGTDYYEPNDAIPRFQDPTVSDRLSSTRYCPESAPSSCFEFNLTEVRDPAVNPFDDAVGRNMSLFHDAFDGQGPPPSPPNGSTPNNGNPWAGADGDTRVVFGKAGGHAGDEVVAIMGKNLPIWWKRTLQRSTFLREDNVFAGLSDVMIEEGINWCARCEVFKLHRSAGDCPERWVGLKPAGLNCSFDPCPPGTTPNNKTRICEPPCPGGFFDPITMKCIIFE